jgi:cytochrome c biogenesis protein CcmG/thiol:disulfide interchange protein DsbE
MNRRTILTIVGLAAVAGAAWLLEPIVMHKAAHAILASDKESGKENGPEINVGMPAPDFTLRNAAGERVRLSDFRGKVVVLNFWATWCGPCKIEIPWFIDFQNEFAARGFTVLGVSMDENGWSVVKPFMAEQKMNYPVVLGNEEVNRLYAGIEALPTTIVISRDGRTRYLHAGLVGKDEYRKEILTLLGPPPASIP